MPPQWRENNLYTKHTYQDDFGHLQRNTGIWKTVEKWLNKSEVNDF